MAILSRRLVRVEVTGKVGYKWVVGERRPALHKMGWGEGKTARQAAVHQRARDPDSIGQFIVPLLLFPLPIRFRPL